MTTLVIKRTGPIFKPGVPKRVIDRHLNGAVRDLTEMGEERLAKTLRARPAGVFLSVRQARPGRATTGHYRRSVSSRVEHLAARISDGGVIYGPWLEGTGSRNKTTRFKGYASFRRVGQWLERQKRRVLHAHARRIVRDLGGR